MGDLINRQVALGEIKARFDDAREWYRTAKDEDIKARAEATIMSFTECSLMLKKLPSANTCENASEITRKSNAKDLISREGAIELFEKYSYPIEHDMGSVERGMTLYGIKQVLEELPSAEPQWIPCSERLPKIGHNILITNRQGYTGEGEYKGHNGYHHVWYQYRWNATLWEDEVLAWMPLPPAYSHTPTQAELEDIFRPE